jgi:xylulokinase
MAYHLGVDTGTSSCKAALIDSNGKIAGRSIVEYSLDYSHEGVWIEFDALKWYSAAVKAIKSCMWESSIKKEEVLSIGLTGQMVSLLGLDKNGDPVRPVIMWMDKRNIPETEELKAAMGEKISRITCNPVNQQYTLTKLVWLKKHEPETYAKINKILLSKDYIRYRLTNEFATDCNDASSTLMHDIRTNTWSKEILGELNIDPGLLPDIYYSTQITGKITKKAAEETGLMEGTPVVAGSGDLGAENFAAKAFNPGDCMMRLGSAAAMTVPVNEPILDPQLKGICSGYYKDGIWLIQGTTQAFAHVMRWVRDTFASGVYNKPLDNNLYEQLEKEAQDIPVGSTGLIFNPFINGAPYWKSHLKGAFIGVSPAHKLGHFIRAAQEGAACALKDGMDDLEKYANISIKECVVTGGGGKSKVWTQMIANLLDKELIVTPAVDACTGAAMMGAIGIGLNKDALISGLWENYEIERITPNKDKEDNKKMYGHYTKAHNLLEKFFLDLSNA